MRNSKKAEKPKKAKKVRTPDGRWVYPYFTKDGNWINPDGTIVTGNVKRKIKIDVREI